MPLSTESQPPSGSSFLLKPPDWGARLLGATIGIQQHDRNLWDKVIEKVKTICHDWKELGVSLRGKALAVKTLLMSQTMFLLHVQNMPDPVAKQLDRIIALFIRGTERREWACREFLYSAKEDGGLDISSVRLWKKGVWRSTVTKLETPSFWTNLQANALEHESRIFEALRTSKSLPSCRRPKEILTILRLAFPVERVLRKTA